MASMELSVENGDKIVSDISQQRFDAFGLLVKGKSDGILVEANGVRRKCETQRQGNGSGKKYPISSI